MSTTELKKSIEVAKDQFAELFDKMTTEISLEGFENVSDEDYKLVLSFIEESNTSPLAKALGSSFIKRYKNVYIDHAGNIKTIDLHPTDE